MSQIGDRAAVPGLITALKDNDAEVRQQAAFALSQIGDESAIDALTAAIKDPVADVRQQAIFALTQIADGGGHRRHNPQPVAAPAKPQAAPMPQPAPPPAEAAVKRSLRPEAGLKPRLPRLDPAGGAAEPANLATSR